MTKFRLFGHKTNLYFFLAYLLLGSFIRFQYWSSKPSELNVGDYGGYSGPAFAMRHAYDTATREPFWVWVLKGWFWITGTHSSDGSFWTGSALGFVWFPIILFMSMRFCESYFGKWQAAILGWILCVSNFQIFHEFLGLREPLESVLVLSLVTIFLKRGEPPAWTMFRSAALCLIGSALMLIRVGYVQVLFLVFPLFFLLNRWKVRRAFLIWALGFMTVLPYYRYSQATYGDPLYFSHLELGKLWGRDFKHREGYPRNWDEWEQQKEIGVKPMSLGEFLFKKHRLRQFPSVVAGGVYKIFFYYDTVEHLIFFRYPINTLIPKVRPVIFTYIFFLCAGYLSILASASQWKFLLFLFMIFLQFYVGAHIYVLHRYMTSISPLLFMTLSQGLVTAPSKMRAWGVRGFVARVASHFPAWRS